MPFKRRFLEIPFKGNNYSRTIWMKSYLFKCVVISIALSLFLAGCSTPIGVRKQSPSNSYEKKVESPLNESLPSDTTKVVLNRFVLSDLFEKNPEAAIKKLHEIALKDKRRDTLFALSELTYYHGENLVRKMTAEGREKASEYFLLSAIYAYTSATDKRYEPAMNLFDHRVRRACDIYNYALWRAFESEQREGLEITDSIRSIPFGKLSISLNTDNFPVSLYLVKKFEAADKYSIEGLSIRNRTNGIGLPMVAVISSEESVSGTQTVPLTCFFRIQGELEKIGTSDFNATLELYSSFENTSVNVNNIKIPLETDTTTHLAYRLSDEQIWSYGSEMFLGNLQDVPNKLILFQPYDPKKIPVVFVHGTFSSPVWWAEMINSLNGDPTIGNKYQFWYFFYNSSKPVSMSAADLRSKLRKTYEKLNPENKPGPIQDMVIIGHSQGGLLTKLTAIDTKDKLLKAVIKDDLDKINVDKETKAIIKNNLVIEHLPFLKRVVFISTPHRGSFLSKSYVRNLVRDLVTLPQTLIKQSMNIYGFLSDGFKHLWGGKVPTSIDSMSPNNPGLNMVADMPLAEGIKGHSIIAIDGDENPPNGNDGVVEYKSAHLEGMESEFIVRSGHSCQDKPETIEEVRRILLKHLDSVQDFSAK